MVLFCNLKKKKKSQIQEFIKMQKYPINIMNYQEIVRICDVFFFFKIHHILQGIKEFQPYINEFNSFEDAFDMMWTTLSQQMATHACTAKILLSRIGFLTIARGADFTIPKTFKTLPHEWIKRKLARILFYSMLIIL